MTPYLRAVAHGGSASIEAWQSHLIEFHRCFPDATTLPMALLRAPNGDTSYAFAAALIHADAPFVRRVLDIGCGEGRFLQALAHAYESPLSLRGIDLSEGEAARARTTLPQATIDAGDVGVSIYPDASYDLVTGHLIFALLPRLRSIFTRIHSWLAPGGTLAMVLEDPLTESSIFRAVSGALQPVRNRFPSFAPAVPERDRCEDDAVLTALLREGGFSSTPRIERYALAARLDANEMWEILRRTYALGLLPLDLQDEAKHAMSSSLGDLGSDRRIDASMTLRLVTAVR